MATIRPTIGRKVYFNPSNAKAPSDGSPFDALARSHGGDQGHPSYQPFDATIVYVHSDSMVNLAINDHGGTPTARHSVPLWNGEGPRPGPTESFAEWMPFQLATAKAQT